MNRKFYLTAACILSFVMANAQTDADTATMYPGVQYHGDTTKHEATEFYRPVPPIVTPGKIVAMHHQMPSFCLMVRTWINGNLSKTHQSRQIGLLPMVC